MPATRLEQGAPNPDGEVASALAGHAQADAERRARLAHELREDLAQVLGYFNFQLEAIAALLRAGESVWAVEQLEGLARAAREAYADLPGKAATLGST